ncbi:MAG: hypothetical protein KF709_05155 [Gemmatimonadaceae bacterium]|nr:hypothetical protein [Gemmatimonadaceae bacterium]
MHRNMRPFIVSLALSVLALLVATPSIGAAQGSRDLVVILHGMGRTPRSMSALAEALEGAGFSVLNIGYSSYCCSIPELGATVRREIDAARGDATTVHFVGHSLGGILIRWMLAQDEPPAGVGRVVLMAPPNQGAKSADRYAGILGWMLEPIDELRTDSSATVQKLPPSIGVPVGIIAAAHDGKVRVEETHLKDETAHVIVDANHAFVMRNDTAIALTLAFLRTGRFPPVDSVAP